MSLFVKERGQRTPEPKGAHLCITELAKMAQSESGEIL